MTVKIQDEHIQLTQDLKARNKEVDKAFQHIIQSSKSLLLPFESKKYRTVILVQHSKSGKETNLVSEFVCFFWNMTLATNRAGFRMIYFSYDEDSLAKFGLRLYNRAIRQVVKHTMFESTKINIEDCVRISPEESKVQSFFINRLANGENDFVSIEVVENVTL